MLVKEEVFRYSMYICLLYVMCHRGLSGVTVGHQRKNLNFSQQCVKTDHNKIHLAWFPQRSKKLFFLQTRPSLY